MKWDTDLPSSPGWRGCWSCGWQTARSSSGHASSLLLPGATGERPWTWCPLAAGLGAHGPPWQSLRVRLVAARHGNQPEGHLISGHRSQNIYISNNNKIKVFGENTFSSAGAQKTNVHVSGFGVSLLNVHPVAFRPHLRYMIYRALKPRQRANRCYLPSVLAANKCGARHNLR